MKITDEYINDLFEGTNFGEEINNSVSRKRKLIKNILKNQLKGFSCGREIYKIIVIGGFIVNMRSIRDRNLTKLGEILINE